MWAPPRDGYGHDPWSNCNAGELRQQPPLVRKGPRDRALAPIRPLPSLPMNGAIRSAEFGREGNGVPDGAAARSRRAARQPGRAWAFFRGPPTCSSTARIAQGHLSSLYLIALGSNRAHAFYDARGARWCARRRPGGGLCFGDGWRLAALAGDRQSCADRRRRGACFAKCSAPGCFGDRIWLPSRCLPRAKRNR